MNAFAEPPGRADRPRLGGASPSPFEVVADSARKLRSSPNARTSLRLGRLLATFAFVFGSCTLLAPYDQVTDQAVNELTIKTETALARADAGQLSAVESERFLMESIGAVRALKARADLKEKNVEEQGTLKELEEQFQALAARRKPLRRSLATGLRATLLDLQQIQIAKKRSAAFGAGLKAKQAAP